MKLKGFLIGFALTAMVLGANAFAAVVVDIDRGAGNLDILYGSGGFASIDGYFVIDVVGTIGTGSVGSVSGLSFSHSISSINPGLMQVQYRLENTSASDDFGIGFISRADPDGDSTDFFSSEVANPIWPGTAPANEAVRWEIDDFFSGNLDQNILNLGQLDNANGCGADCDVLMALQWNFGMLKLTPGQIALINLGLSDDGQTLSSRLLAAALDNGAGAGIDPVLTFSGTATVVPLPAPIVLLAGGLLALAGIRRSSRRHAG